MFFIRSSASKSEQEAKSKFADPLFANGRVVLTDGSAVQVAELEQHVERTAFVPLSFTQAKVSEVVSDLEKMKAKYEDHVSRMKDFYDKSVDATKAHYEAYILDLKSKAVKHVELERRIRNQMEIDMSIKLKASEDTVEELRSSLAELNLESQKTIRDLQRQIREADERAAILSNQVAAITSQLLCSELVGSVTSKLASRRYLDLIKGEEEDRLLLKGSLEKEITSLELVIAELNDKHSAEIRHHESTIAKLNVELELALATVDSLRISLTSTTVSSFVSKGVDEAKAGVLNSQLIGYQNQLQATQRFAETKLEDATIQGERRISALGQQLKDLELELKETIASDKVNANTIVKLNCRAVTDYLISAIERAEIASFQATIRVQDEKLDENSAEIKRLTQEILDLKSKSSELANASEAAQRQEIEFLREQFSQDLGQQRNLLQETHFLEADSLRESMNRFQMELEELRQLSVRPSVKLEPKKEVDATTVGIDLLALPSSEINTENLALTSTEDEERKIEIPAATSALNDSPVMEGEENPKLMTLKSQFTLTFNNDDARDDIAQLGAENQRLLTIIAGLEAQIKLLSDSLPSQSETEPAAPGNDYSAEIEALGEDIIRYNESLNALRAKEAELRDQTTYYANLKKSKKNEIKQWVQAFREQHNRAPEKSDKDEIKETFQEYQEANDNLARCNQQSQEISIEERAVEEQLNIAKLTFSRLKKQRSDGTDPGGSSFRLKDSRSTANDQAIEELEDRVFNLQEEIALLKSTLDKSADDNLILHQQLDMFVKEKRSDVVKQFEQEIATLTATEKELRDSVATLSAAKSKADVKIQELKERAEQAEAELKRRDDVEMGLITPTDEKKELKIQVNKQREAIVMKTKAATAGWDAAADADERLSKEVDAAYTRGLKEGRQKNSMAWDALNAAVEVKENRITELMVNIVAMEDKVRLAQEEAKNMKQQLDAAKLEIADTVAMFATGDGGGGGASTADLDAARESLDAAQEEVVTLNEKCESLLGEISILEQKIAVFEQILAEKQTDSVVLSTPAPSTSVRGNDHDKEANIAILIMLKNVLGKGIGLWKANKKEDCFTLYQKACEDAVAKLNRKSAVRGGIVDALSSARQQGSAAAAKTKAAIALRKCLDIAVENLQREIDSPDISTPAVVASAGGSQSSALVDALKSQLAILDKQREVTVQMRTTAAESVEASPDSTSASSSLLKRAKAAEAKVEMLKKQLANALQGKFEADGEGAPSPDSRSVAASAQGGPAVKAANKSAPAASAARGADPAEVRKLQRQIKELEMKLNSAESSGGAVDKKAVAAAEKAQQKKIKDMETSFRKEKAALENRAIKAEGALEAATASLPLITSERDQLRVKVKELSDLVTEVETLREQAAKGAEYQAALGERERELNMLQEQFKKETFLRKKYKNELEDLKGTIRVYARCRPFAQYELDRGCQSVVNFPDDATVKLSTSRGEKIFEFDTAFTPTSTQEQVFEDTKRLVESCLDGYNVCLFAYGQTGSGKTHTMTGSPSSPGITPSAIDELFLLIKERAHCVCTVSTYFVELYNDNLVDLYWQLDNDRRKLEPPKLDIKMDDKKMVFIKGAVIKEANSPADLMELFNLGNAQRHTGATKMNAESSRSHSIFAIMVSSYDRNTKKTTTGKLSLVDLAGSERADKTGASAERLKEAQNINKSLSALGNVIAALSEGEKFIPYRDNKLTQLMQDSLGGNAKTLMFVNFSPADYNSDETSSSLSYATRVKKITNNASKQAESEEVARLKAIIKRLQGGGTVVPELEGAAIGEVPPTAAVAVDPDDDNPDFVYNELEN